MKMCNIQQQLSGSRYLYMVVVPIYWIYLARVSTYYTYQVQYTLSEVIEPDGLFVFVHMIHTAAAGEEYKPLPGMLQ